MIKRAKKTIKNLRVRKKALPLYPQLRFASANHATVAQLVERDLAKVEVAGPSPVYRSNNNKQTVVQVAELVDALL